MLRLRLRLLARLSQRHRRGLLLCQALGVRLLTRLRTMPRALCRRLLRPQGKARGLRGRRYRPRWTLHQRRCSVRERLPLRSGHQRRRCQMCGEPRCPVIGVSIGCSNRRARGFLRLLIRHGLWLPLRRVQRLLSRHSRLLRRPVRLQRLRGLLWRLDLLLRRMRWRQLRLLSRQSRLLRRQARLQRLRGLRGRLDLLLRRRRQPRC